LNSYTYGVLFVNTYIGNSDDGGIYERVMYIENPEEIVLYTEIQCHLFRLTLLLQTLILSLLQLKLHLDVGTDDQACKLCTYLEKLRNFEFPILTRFL